jgi:hypothetical protein
MAQPRPAGRDPGRAERRPADPTGPRDDDRDVGGDLAASERPRRVAVVVDHGHAAQADADAASHAAGLRAAGVDVRPQVLDHRAVGRAADLHLVGQLAGHPGRLDAPGADHDRHVRSEDRKAERRAGDQREFPTVEAGVVVAQELLDQEYRQPG